MNARTRRCATVVEGEKSSGAECGLVKVCGVGWGGGHGETALRDSGVHATFVERIFGVVL